MALYLGLVDDGSEGEDNFTPAVANPHQHLVLVQLCQTCLA